MKQETAQHTPGPWEILSSLNNHMICDGKKSVVAVAVNSNEEANARLIAAAPLLLEALKRILDCTSEQSSEAFFMRFDASLDQARAAIAAAQP